MDQLAALGIGIATLVIVLSVALLVMADVQTQIIATQGFNVSNTSARTTAYNATETLVNATGTIPPWIPLVVIVVIGGAIIGLVSVFRRNGR